MYSPINNALNLSRSFADAGSLTIAAMQLKKDKKKSNDQEKFEKSLKKIKVRFFELEKSINKYLVIYASGGSRRDRTLKINPEFIIYAMYAASSLESK